jgi:hypothetical protein
MENNTIKKFSLKKMYEDNPKELFFRIATSLLSMFMIPKVILLMFVVYMSEANFFSYDFFTDGIFGMKLFFAVTMFFLFTMAWTLFGFSIVFWGYYKKKKVKDIFKTSLLFFLIMNILSLIILSIGVYEKILPIGWFIFLVLVSIMICVQISVVLYEKARVQFASLLFFISMSLSMSFIFSSEISKLLSFGLKKFGSGGGIATEIKTVSNNEQKANYF